MQRITKLQNKMKRERSARRGGEGSKDHSRLSRLDDNEQRLTDERPLFDK